MDAPALVAASRTYAQSSVVEEGDLFPIWMSSWLKADATIKGVPMMAVSEGLGAGSYEGGCFTNAVGAERENTKNRSL